MTAELPSPQQPGVSALVSGYASLDRAVRVDRCPGPGTTGVIREIVDTKLRPGGIAYAALALAAGGIDVTALTSVGEDEHGMAYLAALDAGGCDTSRVLVRGDRSPSTDLLYADDGSTSCLFDPGTAGAWPLDVSHTTLAGEVDLVVCMVGPAAVTEAVLDALPDDTPLGWVIKDDQEALGGGLNRRLSGRADLIFCNRTERTLIEPSVLDDHTIVVQTAGADAVEVAKGAESTVYPVPALAPVPTDPTGAGDAFAGGFLAAHLRGATVDEAIAAALAAARSLLEHRSSDETR